MIKKLAKYIKQYKKDTILTPIFVIFEVILEVLIPFLMAKIIDVGIQNNDLNYIFKIGIILVVSALLSLTFGMLSGRYASKASAGFAKNLRQGMFYNIQNYSFTNIDKFSTSSLVTRLTTDVTNVQMAFQMIIRILVRAPIMLIFALVMAFSINSKLALIFVVTMPILAVVLFTIAIKAHPYFEKVFRKYDVLNRVVGENLNAIRVVKAYNREEHEQEKFGEVNNEVYKLFKKAEKIVAFNSPAMQLTIYTCILLLSWLGAKMIVGGTMQTGQLSSIITYAWQILSSLMMISFVFVMIIIADSSAKRIMEVLEEESTIKNKENPVKEVKDGSISFENVDFQYDDARAEDELPLEGINIDIKSGETIGIIGATGSSKSTIVNLIPRLYDVTKGSIKVGGVDVRDYDIETLRNEVAVVLQKNVLFSGTIKENLKWGNKNATDEEVYEAAKLSNADKFIKHLPHGYDTMIEGSGEGLSQGQRQLLSIARAALNNPPVLILDEATSSIDTRTEKVVQDGMDQLMKGRTVFVIAHRLSTIKNSDLIMVLDHGKIMERGKHEELIKQHGMYYGLYTGAIEID